MKTLTIDGETHTIREWAIISKQKYGLSAKLSSIVGCIYARLEKGKDPKQAVFYLSDADEVILVKKQEINKPTVPSSPVKVLRSKYNEIDMFMFRWGYRDPEGD